MAILSAGESLLHLLICNLISKKTQEHLKLPQQAKSGIQGSLPYFILIIRAEANAKTYHSSLYPAFIIKYLLQSLLYTYGGYPLAEDNI